jgi:3'(2'), 5'-bisphosphate nucleotidase
VLPSTIDHRYRRELETALDAARLAGQELQRLYVEFKALAHAPASISTDADRASQEIILQRIRRDFPDDALCAEEETPTLAGAARTGSRVWIVDPIDGTRGFVMKNGEFSVMIGFVDQGQIAVGVVLEPALDRVTFAARGAGCWWQEGDGAARPSRVSSANTLATAVLVQSHSKPGKRSPWLEALKPDRVIETYSAGVKLALVARGEADLYLNTYSEFHDWDICAGHILLEEAGGRATGLKGEPLRYGSPGAWQRHGLLGSNGHVHDEAVKAIAAIPLGG